MDTAQTVFIKSVGYESVGFTPQMPKLCLTAMLMKKDARIMNSTTTREAEIETAEEQQIRAALNRHWTASAEGDLETEHDIYQEDAICDYPQSGERIHGRGNL